MSIPSIFKKRFTEKALRKKILDRLYVAKDKEYVEGLFKKGDDGLYTADPAADASKETEKRLKALAKAIKANSGFIGVPKLAAALILLAAAAAGYYLFRNLVVEKALEAGLRSAFGAQADVRDLDFDLFGARITWSGLEVADRDRPMKNLFELGPTAADLDMAGLLRLRFVVEKLESRDLRWNTDRKTSGALPGAPEPPGEEGAGLFGGAADSAMSSLSSFDAKALLDKEYDKLATPKAAEKVKADLAALKVSLSERSAAVRKELDAASGTAAELKSIDVKSIKTVDGAAAALAKVNSTLPAIQRVSTVADALKRDVELASKSAAAAKKELEKAIDADYARVEALVSLSGGDAASLAKGLFADYAEKNLGAWYRYAKRAVEIGRNLAGKRGEKDAAEAAPSSGRGRDIAFPVRGELPRFWIKAFAFKTASAPLVEGTAADITGEPDLVGRPAVFGAAYKEGGAAFNLDGILDLRSGAAADAEMKIAARGLPAAVELPSPVMSIKSLKGPLDLKAGMRLPRSGGMAGELDGVMTRPKVEKSGREDEISNIAYSITAGAPAVDLAAEYSVGSGGGMELKLSSSLDKAVKKSLRGYIADQEKKYKAQAKEELRKRLESTLAENETLQAGFAEVEKAAGGDIAEAGALKTAAEGKKKEIEKRADELKKQAADTLLKKLPRF